MSLAIRGGRRRSDTGRYVAAAGSIVRLVSPSPAEINMSQIVSNSIAMLFSDAPARVPMRMGKDIVGRQTVELRQSLHTWVNTQLVSGGMRGRMPHGSSP